MNPVNLNALNRRAIPLAFLFASLSALITGCGDDHAQPKGSGGDASHAPAGGGREAQHAGHGGVIPLGSADVAGFAFTAKRAEKVTPGEELDLDLEFAAGAKRPGIARAWIGAEDGVGSLKTMLKPEGDRLLHGHVEVPKPLAEGAKLWVELEDGAAKGRTSFVLKP